MTCTRCIRKKQWNKPLDPNHPCKICGEHRTYAWAPFDFEGTDVDVFTLTADPMGDFVNWAIHFEDVGGNDELAKTMVIAGDQFHEFEEDSNESDFFEEEIEDSDQTNESSEKDEIFKDPIIVQNEELSDAERNRQFLQEFWLNNGEFDKNDEPVPKPKKLKEQVRFRNLIYSHAGPSEKI